MNKKFILYLSVFFSSLGWMSHAQNLDSVFTIFGHVVDEKSGYNIPNVHVINKTSLIGTITNGNGFFHMEMTLSDTLVFSNLGYAFSYYTHKKDSKGQIVIALKEKNYLLEEVSVYTYKLTSNDPKPMRMGKPMIPSNDEIDYPESVKPTLANPVDLLYYMFGSRPKQMRKLRELQLQDQYRHKLKEGNNRQVLINMTGLSRDELESFMFFCKYSQTQISTMNDYDFLLSLMSCYEEYLRIQEREELLNDQEQEAQQVKERFK